MKTTGDRIKYVREVLGLTGEEFGKKLNVAKGSVSNWENNNRTPDAEMLVKIADLGNVTVDFLLCRTNTPNHIVYETDVDGHHYKIELEDHEKVEISQDELQKLVKQLREVGFDVNKLIEKAKNDK